MDLKVCGQVLDIYRNNGQSLSIVVRLLELIRVESKFNLIFSFVFHLLFVPMTQMYFGCPPLVSSVQSRLNHPLLLTQTMQQ